jgi:queuosine precursor transporter
MNKFRFYSLLVGLSIMVMMSCDTLAFKVIHVFSRDFAVSGIIFSISFSLSSIITEVYGFNLAGRIVWVQLLCHVFFILLVNLFVILPSPETSSTHELYYNLYHNIWHVLLGSCIAMPTAYFINDIILSKLKINLYGRKFIFRFLISNTLASAALVLISYPVTFHDQYSIQFIMQVAVNTWVYKIIAAVILLPFTMFVINLLKNLEKTDYYDYGTSYNPLKVFSTLELGENKYEASRKINKNYSIDRYPSFEK